ncbi:sigma-54-dependent Fis family transcriptional regulator [Taibaiella sp. KBW10]|uniref:sigma-54 interaction domain-containing protein n=1 Tax=Taibaiella sp. KBW10 TaxID=2153357 RepID=UPI000F5AF29B|nr:sigma-54 dependent transcriptional regulator [Taibaiella sp. KBW10]RQO31383.1 sigma-54-dependent Fis family transcriptional regulator [Taibaiella sp. KBW10]
MDLQSIKNRFGIIGNDPALNYALQVAAQVANTDLSVLIMGESGVGKEIFSQIIHNLSSRKHNPFIAVNCGAIPEGTIDSELFGHEKGSFTSASDQRKGYFETVNGGTIFLDEIGEMPLGTQARLLRMLETGEFIRVGSSKVLKADVRVIAATNKDLLKLTQEGKFREDLYYRLNTVPIRVPALRERLEDIYLLFRKFVIDFSERYKSNPIQLDEEAKQLLVAYPWPGNVRELKNMAEQISVLSTDKIVNAEKLSNFLPKANQGNRMPMLASAMESAPVKSYNASDASSSNTEREILYKLFFDLRKDSNDIKQLLFELLQQQGTGNSMPKTNAPIAAEGFAMPHSYATANNPMPAQENNYVNYPASSGAPVILNNTDGLDLHEEVEESLSLIDKERELITKALQKHKGKRKDAAHELGISERTLYRKIKEYDIDE